MVGIPESGELRGLRLAELLLDLDRADFCGSLELVRGSMSKSLLFREGAPVYAESNLASETLGIQLLDAGLLDRTQHLQVSNHVQTHHCKEGTALLALGLLNPQGLFAALKGQVRARILQCFSWRDGSFNVDAEMAPSVDTQPFRAAVPRLVQEGLESNWSAERIRAELGDTLDAAVFPTPRLAALHPQLCLDAEARRFLVELDRGARLGELLEFVHSRRALAAIWVMFRTGALRAQVSRRERVCERPATANSDAARTPPGKRTATADGGFRREIEEIFEKLSDLDHYRLLGVSPDATIEGIRDAYLHAATRFHPDALVRAGLDAAMRERAGKVFAAMGKARAQLSDPARRREYDAARGEQTGAELEGERALAAETSHRKGEILMQQGNFRGAVTFFEASVSLCPQEPAYLGALGWALFKQNPPDLLRAREHLERAMEGAPDDPRFAENLARLDCESRGEQAASR